MPSTPIDVELIQTHREYNPDLFVDRTTELRIVEQQVREVQENNSTAQTVINFWGVKGIGKTWLLHHLQRRYHRGNRLAESMRPTFALLYALPNDCDGDVLLEQIARACADQIDQQLTYELRDDHRALLRRIKETGNIAMMIELLLMLSHEFVPLLLFDSQGPRENTNWSGVEQHVIEPLVSTGRILVVVAGRRQVPRWKRFEVRRRALGPDTSQISPFDKQAVREQIGQNQFPIHPLVDKLFPYTVGNPHLVDTLARHIVQWSRVPEATEVNPAWFVEPHEGLLQVLRTSEDQMLENIPADLRPVFEALAPLRFFRLEALRAILIAHEQPTERRSDGYYLNLLRAIEQTEVVWWERARRAYVTSEIIRKLMNRRQRLEEPTTYARQHQQAVDMYWEWVEACPEACEDFVLEIWFHLTCLMEMDDDRARLRNQAHAVLQRVGPHLDSEHLLIFQNQLASDRELLDMLPDNLHTELSAAIEDWLNRAALQRSAAYEGDENDE